jgi:glutamine amidotransferase
MQMTLGISDGKSLYACRYSTKRQTRTLYHTASVDAIRDVVPSAERFSSDMRAIVSEPLSDLAEVWVPVPESSFVKVSAGDVSVTEFVPAQ